MSFDLGWLGDYRARAESLTTQQDTIYKGGIFWSPLAPNCVLLPKENEGWMDAHFLLLVSVFSSLNTEGRNSVVYSVLLSTSPEVDQREVLSSILHQIKITWPEVKVWRGVLGSLFLVHMDGPDVTLYHHPD